MAFSEVAGFAERLQTSLASHCFTLQSGWRLQRYRVVFKHKKLVGTDFSVFWVTSFCASLSTAYEQKQIWRYTQANVL